MSIRPEFFRQQTLSAWIGFGLFAAVLCILYPALIGVAIGIGASTFVMWIFYRALGG